MISNKKLSPIVTELFIKGIKLNISTAFITQSHFQAPKDVQLNCINFLFQIPNKREFQQIAFNHLLDIGFEDMNHYKKCTTKQYSFLMIDTTLA